MKTKKLLLLGIAGLISSFLYAQHTFQRNLGTFDNENGSVILESTESGNDYFYLAGYTDTSSSDTSKNILITKTDEKGQVVWSYQYGGNDDEEPYSMIKASNEIVLTGYTESYGNGGKDIFILKVDLNGNVQAFETLGGTENETGRQVISTHSGGFAVVGYTNTYGNGKTDGLIATFTSSLSLNWAKVFGGNRIDKFYSLVQKPDSNFLISGSSRSYSGFLPRDQVWLLELGLLGNLNWSKKYNMGLTNVRGKHIIAADSNKFIIFGDYIHASTGSIYQDILIKLNSSGTPSWINKYGRSSYHEYPGSIVFYDSSSYVFVSRTDTLNNDNPVFIASIDLNGNVSWSRYYDNTTSDFTSWGINSIIEVGNDNGLATLARADQNTNGGEDLHFLRTDQNGYTYDSTSTDSCNVSTFNLPKSTDSADVVSISPANSGINDTLSHSITRDTILLGNKVNCLYLDTADSCTNCRVVSIINMSGQSSPVEVKLYPNPVNRGEELAIEGNTDQVGLLIDIYSINGENILSETVNQKGPYKISISTNDFTKGLYLIKVTDSTFNQTTKKVIIK